MQKIILSHSFNLDFRGPFLLFNSLTFAVFFAITYGLYVFSRHRLQNVILLIASYVFYGFWDWRFLGLIAGSTVVDYFCGLAIDGNSSPRRRLGFLLASVSTNLGLLGFFKYAGFFSESFRALTLSVGWEVDAFTLNVILPVGISFYTFQTMSYTIDIYREKMEPTRNFLNFAVFVAFFPQLVAGPIERASNLLKQVELPRQVSEKQFQHGLWLIFFGLFKKIFIADNLAPMVDRAFSQGGDLSGAEILVAVYAFAFQIYGDFSGYSDIARGISKLMGFELMLNFRMPYFARNVQEFWHRWHISLSSWLRDYLYISLGGGRRAPWRVYFNLIMTMVLGGLWHGAAWTFVLWGAYQGTLLAVHRLLKPVLQVAGRLFGKLGLLRELMSIFITFQFVCLGWLIFRAESVSQIIDFLRRIVLNFGSLATVSQDLTRLGFYITVLLLIQMAKEISGDMHVIDRLSWLAKGPLYLIMAVLLITAGAAGGRTFIYFQF